MNSQSQISTDLNVRSYYILYDLVCSKGWFCIGISKPFENIFNKFSISVISSVLEKEGHWHHHFSYYKRIFIVTHVFGIFLLWIRRDNHMTPRRPLPQYILPRFRSTALAGYRSMLEYIKTLYYEMCNMEYFQRKYLVAEWLLRTHIITRRDNYSFLISHDTLTHNTLSLDI